MGGTPARGGGQGVGSQGDPDPGVHYIVIVDNPTVRVLQVTLQPGAVRRQHVHNDVTFHMMIPVTGTLEVTADGLGTINAIPGQAYYMVKGQPHGFANKGAAARVKSGRKIAVFIMRVVSGLMTIGKVQGYRCAAVNRIECSLEHAE